MKISTLARCAMGTAILALSATASALTLSSPAFSNNGVIPDAFTFSFGSQCRGANLSPPLEIADVPAGTKSFALTVRDPDGGNWLHWFAWNIPTSQTSLAFNASAVATFSQGVNDFGVTGYGGPCPPTPNHRYIFTLHALDRTFSAQPSAAELASAALQTAVLTGYRSPTDAVSWSPNYTALWWNDQEIGWGINLNHQGSILFATLFTYSATGTPLWLVMSKGALQADGRTFVGPLYQTKGSPYNAVPFVPLVAEDITTVGTMSVSFSSGDSATVAYSVNGTQVTKQVKRQVFGWRAANCTPTTGSRAALTNYQDLWFNPAEEGWGINITHQDDILFATLFAYGLDGKNLWLVMSGGRRQADGSFVGDLYQTTGPAFYSQPFKPIGLENMTKVGTLQLRFGNGENGTLIYSVNGASVSKQITRQVFGLTVPACS